MRQKALTIVDQIAQKIVNDIAVVNNKGQLTELILPQIIKAGDPEREFRVEYFFDWMPCEKIIYKDGKVSFYLNRSYFDSTVMAESDLYFHFLDEREIIVFLMEIYPQTQNLYLVNHKIRGLYGEGADRREWWVSVCPRHSVNYWAKYYRRNSDENSKAYNLQ